jgi:two-component system, OmpR family, response regulator
MDVCLEMVSVNAANEGPVNRDRGEPLPREPMIDRVKAVAQAITHRVREAIAHHDHDLTTLSAPNGHAPHPLRVLVVDDNSDAADALAAVVELLGCDVRACYDGESALDAVRVELPDVCLLDLMMPRLDGLELAGLIRSQVGRRPLLLVATTALGSLEDRTATALAGFHFHLVKPIDTPTLRAALDRFRTLTRRPPFSSDE